jgi:sporulation protein YlmC with PRC-barrel domain
VHPTELEGKVTMQSTDTATVRVLSAGTLTGDKVVDPMGEKLGKLEELMIDLDRGTIAYAVLSVGGVLGMGDKLFAIPWSSFRVDAGEKQLILNVDKSVLESAPGFDKDHWPNFADMTWGATVYRHYGSKPFWE